MRKPNDPRELAVALLSRSECAVQVAAVLADRWGIFGWGWNSSGSGFGEHAEAAAFRRANRKRLEWATLYVASQRVRNGKAVCSLPCEDCERLIVKVGIRRVWWRNNTGVWHMVTKL